MCSVAYKWSATILMPHPFHFGIAHDANIYVFYTMYKVFNVLANIHFVRGKKMWRWQGKATFRRNMVIFIGFSLLFIKLFALYFCDGSLCVYVCVSCVLTYKLSRRNYVIGEQFKRNACRLSLNMSILHTYLHQYLSLGYSISSRIIWRSLTLYTIHCMYCIILCVYWDW